MIETAEAVVKCFLKILLSAVLGEIRCSLFEMDLSIGSE
jgi:hypothetical protein